MFEPKFHHCTNLSDDSFLALLDALGLQNEGNKRDESDLRISYPPCRSFLGSPCEFEDTLPSRRRALKFISGVDHTVASSKAPTTRRLAKPRPPALYLPNGVPISVLNTTINEPTWWGSLQSDPTTVSIKRRATVSAPGSTIPTKDLSICIKAAFNATIIMLRASRTISLAELKKRLYDKFVGQEGMRMSRRLTVVSVRPPSNKQAPLSSAWVGGGRTRQVVRLRRTRSFMEPRRFSFAELTQMHFIEDEVDWEKILASHCADGTKVTVRILDTSM